MKSATADAPTLCARAIDVDPWFRVRRGRRRKTNKGKKKKERWREKEKKMLNGEAEKRRGYRMGGRNVLGTRRVSIKWLWPVRYGGSLPRRDMHTLGLSTHRVHHTYACRVLHTFTHVSRETRRKSIYKGNIHRFALVVFRRLPLHSREKSWKIYKYAILCLAWSIFIS